MPFFIVEVLKLIYLFSWDFSDVFLGHIFHWLQSRWNRTHFIWDRHLLFPFKKNRGTLSHFSPWFLHHGVWVCSVLPWFPIALVQVLQVPAVLPTSFLFPSNHLRLFPVFWSFGSSDGNQEHFRVLCPSIRLPSISNIVFWVLYQPLSFI